jgi:hypothetical protein
MMFGVIVARKGKVSGGLSRSDKALISLIGA